MASYIAGRAHPAQADMRAGDDESVHGKHHPLQWNMGSVHR